MNRIILQLDRLLPSTDLNKLLQASKSAVYHDNAVVVAAFDNVRKVYHVVGGCLAVKVENRYKLLKDVAGEYGADDVTPNDVAMAPDVDAKIEYREGSYALYENCLYEQFFPMTLYCKEQARVIEIDGNLFKAMFHGIY